MWGEWEVIVKSEFCIREGVCKKYFFFCVLVKVLNVFKIYIYVFIDFCFVCCRDIYIRVIIWDLRFGYLNEGFN